MIQDVNLRSADLLADLQLDLIIILRKIGNSDIIKGMVDFTGYAKKPEPKWTYIIISLAVLAAVVIFYSGLEIFYEYSEPVKSAPSKVKPKPKEQLKEAEPGVSKESAVNKPLTLSEVVAMKWQPPVSVEALTLSSEIGENNMPIGQASMFSNKEDRRIYCYTKIRNISGPRVIRHVWISPRGNVVADTKISIDNSISNVWSYVNVLGKTPGAWEVRIITDDGKLLYKRSFTITD
jgi:hypothetical protein